MSFGQFLPKSLDSDLDLLAFEKEFSPIDIDLYRSIEDSDQTENVQGPSTSISFRDDGSVFYSANIPTSGNVGGPVLRSWGLTNPFSVEDGNFYTNLQNMSPTILSSFISTNSSQLGYPYSRIDTAKFKDGGSKLLIGSNKPTSSLGGRTSSIPTMGIISYGNPSNYWGLAPSNYTVSVSQYYTPSNESFYLPVYSRSVQFSPDGSKIFVLNGLEDLIEEYSLSIPWDITSNAVEQNSLSVTNEESVPNGFKFSGDGTKIFLVGRSDSIHQYNLTSPYTLSGSSYSGISYDFSSQTTVDQEDILFNDDGTKMYILSGSGIFQYNLSSPYDLSNVTFNASDASIISYSGRFSPDGDKLYIVDGGYIVEYTLLTPYDISTVNSSRTLYYLSSYISSFNLRDIEFSGDGDYIYFITDYFQTDIFRFPLTQSFFPAEGSIVHTGILRREVSVDASNDGTKVIVLDDAYSNPNVDVLPDNSLYQMLKSYTLSTPWDFSTIQFSSQYLVDTPGKGRISTNEEGNRVYMISRDTSSNVENIHIFHLADPFDVSTIYKEEKRQIYSSPTSDIFAFTTEENGKRLYYHRDLEEKNTIYHYGTSPLLSIDNFYRGGKYVPDNNYFRSVCSVPESGEISYLDFYPVNSYTLSSSKDSSDEGESFTVTLSSPTAPDGTSLSYSVSGISDSDLSSGSLTGSFVLSSGSDSKTFTLENDIFTEGPENFVLSLESLDSPSISILINDTSRNFVNFDFSDPQFTVSGSTVSLNGWTAEIEQVRLGVDDIGGFTSPTDPTPNPVGDGGQVSPGDGTLDPSMTYNWELLTEGDLINGAPAGRTCIRLYSSGTVSSDGDVSHGPYVISNDYLPIEAGSTVGFDWRAAAGSDAYDVFAYLLKDDGTVQILLNTTQNATSGDTGWLTVTDTVSQTGNYKFVFVSGTFDYSFGQAAGASLYVTNIEVS